MELLHIRIDKATRQRTEQEAKRLGVSLAGFVRMAVVEKLASLNVIK